MGELAGFLVGAIVITGIIAIILKEKLFKHETLLKKAFGASITAGIICTMIYFATSKQITYVYLIAASVVFIGILINDRKTSK
jgi:uncharacterized membrane protein (DUF485 family)